LGPGSYISGDRSVTYNGTFKDGEYDGQGTSIHSDYTYTGMFKNGSACGQGKLVRAGMTFVGQFENNEYNGHGAQTIHNNYSGLQEDVTYEGIFRNGKKEGLFTVTRNGVVSHKEYVNGVEQSCCVIS
jgi:hypothetical protein